MAAAVYIPPSPHDLFSTMSTNRRAPLASIPNATNSPHRTLTTSSKRPRAAANVVQQENEPPQKRQMVEKTRDPTKPGTPRRRVTAQAAEAKVFEAGPPNAEANSFQRRLVAARERGAPVRATKNEAQQQKEAEVIRQWQKHYRKMFPTFSFYFDNIPEDMRARFARQAAALGAQEEKFFSKTVTHIVTARAIPTEAQPPETTSSNSTSEQSIHADGQPQTINPSLLERNPVSAARSQSVAQVSLSSKRDGPASTDILVRGREMGMKIWASEKFQRILTSVLESADTQGHNTRGTHTTQNLSRLQQEDLSQVLRKERIGTERDQASLTRDIIPFKGPFIYIHDIDAKVRPTMVREYQKPKCKGDGEWPQFRTSGAGKCPFVEDMSLRRELEQERKTQVTQEQQQEDPPQAPRTRSMIETKMEPPRRTSPRKALHEIRNFTAGPTLVSANVPEAKPLGPPVVERQTSMPPVFARQSIAPMRPPTAQFGGEPAASGIQRSNLTSAIQSQMISSTAAAPGGKATTSREVNELKRKVLERSHTGSLSMGSVNSIPSSHRMNDLAATLKNARAPAPQRAAKSAAKEKLGGIPEDDPYADDIAAERAAHAASKRTTATKKPAKREAKPGYCENCRDKYEDFEEHTLSRKHRKFAMTSSNWTELDELLRKIQS